MSRHSHIPFAWQTVSAGMAPALFAVLRNIPYFCLRNSADMKLKVDKEYDFLSDWLADLPRRFMTGEGKLLHQGRNTVREFEPSVRLVVKRFKPVNIVQQIAYTFFCKTKAEKAFLFAGLLRERGLDTPREVAYLEESRWGLFKVGYFVSLACDDPPAFPALVPVEDYDRRLASDLVALFYRMHQRGVLHGDLNFGNFLYRRCPEGGYTFTIIDTNRSRFFDHCPDDEACLCNLRTMTHRRDLFAFMVREYARLRGWDADDTEARALRYLKKLEVKHKRKEAWKKFSKLGFRK